MGARRRFGGLAQGNNLKTVARGGLQARLNPGEVAGRFDDARPGAQLIRDGKPTTVGYKDEPKPVALTKPAAIADALATAVAETPRLGDSPDAPKNFRADLWSVADHAPAGALRSRLEVALIHAAHERAQGGRPSSRPYEVAAERLAAQLSPATP